MDFGFILKHLVHTMPMRWGYWTWTNRYVKVVHCDGMTVPGLMKYNVTRRVPDKAIWPYPANAVMYYLLKPLCKLHNALIRRKEVGRV
jgi:hypothetical protein